jgi:hypothetical protein
MTTGRAEFLGLVIQKLDASGIAWCCLRNHREMFVDSRSDVDLLVLPEDIPVFESLLEESCRETGTCLAQEASYLNFSHTYLTPSGQWVRIDYESEIRWRIFPVLRARSVLLRRIRREGLWVASAPDEAVVLWIAALFRHSLSDRYRFRLQELAAEMQDSFPEALKVYREAFGRLGPRLWKIQQAFPADIDFASLWLDLKSTLVLRGFLGFSRARHLFSYFRYDLSRAVHRMIDPRGFFVAVESSSWNHAQSISFLWKFDRVFPVAKSFFLPAGTTRLSWGQRMRIALTLFKGGMVLCPCPNGVQVPLPRNARTLWLRSSTDNRWVGAFLPSGWMISGHPEKDPVEACYQLCLLALTRGTAAPWLGRRLFCVILGLDGSGKTTLARHLAERAGSTTPPLKLRYFHFMPTSPSRPLFPWPGQVAEPKRRESAAQTGGTLASIMRLFRNWIRALWGLAVRNRCFGGVLLGDRYLYNYILDPVSVRYFGPSRLVAWLLRLPPRPDLLLVLETPPETILQRKQELSPEEIRAQSAILREFPFVASRVVRLDGTRAPEELAQDCLREIRLAAEKR